MKNLTSRLLLVLPIVLVIAMMSVVIMFPTVRRLAGPAQTAHAQVSNLGTLWGYAWSDNLGWISFSGSNYQVVVQSDGTLAGYAWANPSDNVAGTNNIGWISFNAADTASCGAVATLSGTTITGWAKVLSADNNGWNGCISLSGSSPAYGITLKSSGSAQSGLLDGYAWADSTVGGWISFNCDTGGSTANNICGTSNYGVLYVTGTPSGSSLAIVGFFGPNRVRSGTSATLTYMVTNPPASCAITGTTSTTTVFSTTVSPIDSVAGTVSTNPIYTDTLFTMTCSGVSKSTNISTTPSFQEK